MTIFDALIWGGTVLTVIGLAGLIWCILTAMRLRRGGVGDDAIRAGMQRVVAMNMAALAASTIGLMLVVAGIMLG
ncbi:MAG: hypothetical protein Q4G14_03545 [Paracoccus sp. (in: a-proteobacteria)]|uniref:hypothetical protein n=1 Tax=Paracoccus sp. TaxID=267 RepID=UPI0026DFC4A6|nr:hypothetical protein [Paracoccus sp. (in: a-proteobacteria)]MDO5612300.1 hypothetical protein [Paracoccus sp. (in: a-proteobacteria)]